MRHTSRKTIVNAKQCTLLNQHIKPTHCRRYRGVNASPRIGTIKQHVLAVALTIVCALCFISTSAAATNGPQQTRTYHLDLPEQTVATALNSLSEQTDIQVLFPYDIAAQLRSEPLLGRFSIELALERLLRDTGLHGGLTSSGVITISQTGSESTTNQNGKGKRMNIKNSTKRKTLLAGLVGLFAAGGTAQVAAQGGEAATSQSAIDEIIVTATKRETSLQDTALSISAIAGGDLNKLGITSYDEILSSVPGLTVVQSGPGESSVSFRGIATSPTGASGLNSTTTYYIDEFPLSLAGFFGSIDVKLVDMEQIEVLKGPQGTLYGQSALGGVIRYITNKPNMEAIEGGLDVAYENVSSGGNGYKTQGYINIPLSENVAVRAVLYNYDRPGFLDNLSTGNDDVDTEDTTGGRLALRWDISDRTAFNLLYYNQTARVRAGQGDSFNQINSIYTPATGNGAPTNVAPPNFDDPSYRSNIDPLTDRDAEVFNLKLDVSFDDFDLTLMGASKQREMFQDADVSQFFSLYDDTTNTLSTLSRKFDAKTFEGRLVSKGDGAVDWIAGLWYEKEDGDGTQTIVTLTPRTDLELFAIPFANGDFIRDRVEFDDQEELSVYGEVGFRFTEQAKLTLGYRRANLKLDSGMLRADGVFDGGSRAAIGVDESTEEDIDTYKVHFEYQFTDDILAHALASSGYRAGGFNRSGFTAVSAASPYESDSLWNYELGVRTSWLDDSLTVNAVAYYIDWSDIQLATYDPESVSTKVQNVGKAEVFGLEAEVRYRVTESLDFGANYGYTDAKLAEDLLSEVTDPPTVLAADGTRLPGSVNDSFSLFVDWESSLTDTVSLLANASYIYTGSREGFLTASPTAVESEDIPSSDFINLSVSLRHTNGITLSLIANNLLDERSVQYRRGFGSSLVDTVVMNRPRVVGLNASYHF